ncbi:MAG: TolC family protein [Bacteroidales bacterium]
MIKIYKLVLIMFLGIFSFSAYSQEDNLDVYLQEAGENNSGLQAAFQQYYAALEKLPQAAALPDPKLSFGYFVSPVETRLGSQQLKMSVSQMFPWFGTLNEQEEAFAEKAKVKYQQFLGLRNKVHKDVKVKYYKLYEVKKAIQITKANLDVLSSLRKITERNYESGKSQMADVLRLNVDIREQENKLEDLQDRMKTLKSEFNLLLNKEEEHEVIVPADMTLDTFDLATLRDSIRNNPELTALIHKEQSLQHQYKVAKKKGFPEISVALDYVVVGERQDMRVANNGRDVIMPMVGISIPLNRNKYRSMKKEKEYEMNAVKSTQQERINSLGAEYNNAEEAYLESERKIKLYKEQVQETQRIYKLLETNYSSDGEDFYELLRTRLMVLEYELKLEKAKAAQNMAVARLEYLTGKK